MLIRILTDNPGTTFTRNIDMRFVNVVRQLLKDGRDMSVQQMLRETLEALQVQKSGDPNLGPLVDMWKKEKEKLEKKYGTSGVIYFPLLIHNGDMQMLTISRVFLCPELKQAPKA